MFAVLPYLLTFATAFAVSYYRVYISEKFQTLFFLLYNDKYIVLYCTCYGLIGVGLFSILKDSALDFLGNNTRIDRVYIKAVSIGLATKAISDINLFDLKVGGTQIPLGVKTLTLPIDKFFEQQFNSSGYVKARAFLTPYYTKFQAKNLDIKQFKQEVSTSLKRFYPDQKQVGYFSTSDNYINSIAADEVLLLVLTEFGVKVFRNTCDNLST